MYNEIGWRHNNNVQNNEINNGNGGEMVAMV